MKTWADERRLVARAETLDRDADEGPPRCCGRRRVAADALVCYDDLAPERLEALLGRFPHLAGVSPLYLCDGCSELLIREAVITREDRALDFGLAQELVDKARDSDALALNGLARSQGSLSTKSVPPPI